MSGNALLLAGFDWKSLTWLGTAQAVADEAFRSSMIAIWSAGLWLMEIVMTLIDVFTTPDLSANGPTRTIVPVMMGVAVCLAVVLFIAQLVTLLVRRDAAAFGQTLLGLMQFGVAWSLYLTAVTVAVMAAQGLTWAVLDVGLHASSFGAIDLTKSFPRQVNDTVTATLLALLTPFLVLPSAVGLMFAMFARGAALLVLTAVSPVTIAGLVNGRTSRWFWVANRWFLAALVMPVLIAIVLSIGVQLIDQVSGGAGGSGAIGTPQAAGSAVIGMVLFAVAAVCPLTLFRLFAFVDPGTTSGAALRQGLAANGWFFGKGADAGSGTAAQPAADGSGQSAGEASAQSAAVNRLAPLLSEMNDTLMGAARATVAVGGDVLNQAGVGHQQHAYWEPSPARRGSSSGQDQVGDSELDDLDEADTGADLQPAESSPGGATEPSVVDTISTGGDSAPTPSAPPELESSPASNGDGPAVDSGSAGPPPPGGWDAEPIAAGGGEASGTAGGASGASTAAPAAGGGGAGGGAAAGAGSATAAETAVVVAAL